MGVAKMPEASISKYQLQMYIICAANSLILNQCRRWIDAFFAQLPE